jgi:hypothetical protein
MCPTCEIRETEKRVFRAMKVDGMLVREDGGGLLVICEAIRRFDDSTILKRGTGQGSGKI